VPDSAGGQSGIGQRPHSQRNLDPCLNEIEIAIVEHGLNVQLGMLGQK
jgi:hypothetical protein